MKTIEEFKNKIIQGDCLEVMKELPDNSVDLVLTDPPYGDGFSYGRDEKTIENNEDESINYKIIPLLYNFIQEKTDFNIRMMLVIVKNNFGMGYGFRNQHELCFVACKHLNRNYIGIEISEKYCKIAKDRLKQETLF
jgi:DNA modification methylase